MKRAALLLLGAAFAVTFAPGPWGDERINDLYLYGEYADLFLGGVLPYRDHGFEYPPLAAAVIALPGIVGTEAEVYRLAFGALVLALLAAMVLLAGALADRTGGNRRIAMIAAALTPIATGAMVRTHFDLVPVVLVLLALLLLCDDRPRAGLAVLGLGVMTKGFPLVVVPPALVWLAARGGWRAALEPAAALALTMGAIGAASVALSPSGALDAVTYHLERPVQVESTPASVLHALDALGAGGENPVSSHNSHGMTHPADGPLVALLGAALVAVVALLAAACARRPDARTLVLASLCAAAAFAALGKVLSPQFLIWIAPLAALALAWRTKALAAAAGGAIALTLVEFPANYAEVVAREPPALGLVAVRNLLLLATVGLSLRYLRESASGPGTSSCSIAVARPSAPASTSTALSHGSSVEVS